MALHNPTIITGSAECVGHIWILFLYGRPHRSWLMLNDAACFKEVYIICGYTDLRSGIDRLAGIISSCSGNQPFVPDTLYLFCGRRTDWIKGLVWENDGFLLLYKRLADSRFQWPRTAD